MQPDSVADPCRSLAFPFDSLAFYQKLEAAGMDPSQARAVASHVLDAVGASAVATRAEARGFQATTEERYRVELEAERLKQAARHEATMSALDRGLASHQASTQRELDRLRAETEKLRAELRFELEKLSSGQRLDKNLEKGRVRDEMAQQSERIAGLDARIDREVQGIRTSIESGKSELLRYSVGTVIAFGGVAISALRLML